MYQATAVLPAAEGRTGLPRTTDYWKSVYIEAGLTPVLFWSLEKKAIRKAVILHQDMAGV